MVDREERKKSQAQTVIPPWQETTPLKREREGCVMLLHLLEEVKAIGAEGMVGRCPLGSSLACPKGLLHLTEPAVSFLIIQ